MTGLLEHVFSVEEWDEMGQTGVFGEDSRVELLDGKVVDMNPIGDRHASCVSRLADMCFRAVSGQAIVSVQNPIRLSSYSEPQPDLALLRYREDFYRNGKPGPSDVLLVVEVADTSLERDWAKGLFYARADISQYWIVDLAGERIIEFTDPSEDGYRNERVATGDDLLVANVLPSENNVASSATTLSPAKAPEPKSARPLMSLTASQILA